MFGYLTLQETIYGVLENANANIKLQQNQAKSNKYYISAGQYNATKILDVTDKSILSAHVCDKHIVLETTECMQALSNRQGKINWVSSTDVKIQPDQLFLQSNNKYMEEQEVVHRISKQTLKYIAIIYGLEIEDQEIKLSCYSTGESALEGEQGQQKQEPGFRDFVLQKKPYQQNNYFEAMFDCNSESDKEKCQAFMNTKISQCSLSIESEWGFEASNGEWINVREKQ